MYGHGFATLFLGEVYGMTGDESVKEKLQQAVRLIQKTQNREGGWRYQPVPYDADISVTICQVMALRAARDAGIKVEKEVIDKAIEYVDELPERRRRLQLHGRQGGGGGSGFARSAAGVAALYYAGVFEGDEIERGLKLPQAVHARQRRANMPDAKATTSTATTTPSRRCSSPAATTGPSGIPAIRDQLIARQDSRRRLDRRCQRRLRAPPWR